MTKSPIRCGECKGTALEPLADVLWSKERAEWVVQWVNLEEGHCNECGATKLFEPNQEDDDDLQS